MDRHQSASAVAVWSTGAPTRKRYAHQLSLRQIFWLVAGCCAVLLLTGRAAPTGIDVRNQRIAAVVADRQFDLLAWEIGSLSEKLSALASRPGAGLTDAEAIQLVRAYLADAQQLGEDERALNRLLSEGASPTDPEILQLRQEVADLRDRQSARRPAVEAILQRQVAAELATVGIGVDSQVLPPVLFTFTEPPKKLVVSPRTRIAIIYSEMLAADVDPVEASTRERAVEAIDPNVSALVTGIGGLGAYPTMVVDRASLPWILSTIAHEWVHNYLTLFPLGLRYGASGELITINETVADIVGDEIGDRVLRRYYPDLVPPEEDASQSTPDLDQAAPQNAQIPPPFDFRREMRETRVRVDGLLAQGLVETAEAYMEARRKFFVAHGYPLRVLNQAYFAFHGSYATGAASTSPIGPKLQRLRAQRGDAAAFLHVVRWITSEKDLDRILRGS